MGFPPKIGRIWCAFKILGDLRHVCPNMPHCRVSGLRLILVLRIVSIRPHLDHVHKSKTSKCSVSEFKSGAFSKCCFCKIEQIEFSAKLLDYFLWSNKSNIIHLFLLLSLQLIPKKNLIISLCFSSSSVSKTLSTPEASWEWVLDNPGYEFDDS